MFVCVFQRVPERDGPDGGGRRWFRKEDNDWSLRDGKEGEMRLGGSLFLLNFFCQIIRNRACNESLNVGYIALF